MAGPAIPFLVRTFGKQIVRSGLQFGGGGTGSALFGAFAGSNRNGIGLNITVGSNIGQLARTIDAFGKQQLPFATHRAINQTAFDVRNEIVKQTFPRSFDMKAKQFARQAFRVERSPNKRKLVARVYDRFGKDYLVNQAEGGTKKKRGRYMSIPAQERPRVSGKATYNRVHPRTVLNRPKAFVQKVGDQHMILERRTKERYPLKRLYLLHQTDAQIPKRFPFYEDARKKVGRVFDKHFATYFAAAKRTAKR